MTILAFRFWKLHGFELPCHHLKRISAAKCSCALALVGALAEEGSQRAFFWVQLAINLIAFPLGMVTIVIIAWPVVRGVRNAQRAGSDLPDPRICQRALMLGKYVAVVGIAGWLVAGLAYPVSISLLVGGLDAQVYLHFAASLVFCGLIAAAYPFFFVTLLSVRVIYPAMLKESLPSETDVVALKRLARYLSFFLLVAGVVPALGIMTLLTSGVFTNSQSTFALLVLSALSAIGLAFAFGLFRALQRDINALVIASSPDQVHEDTTL